MDNTCFDLPTPWDGSSARAWGPLRKLVPHDSATLLLMDPGRPDSAGVLDTRGVTGKQIADWLAQVGKGKRDALLRQAARSGLAVTEKAPASAAAGLPGGQHMAVAAARCVPGERRVWALALGRKKKRYSEAECARVGLALEAIRNRFDTVPPGETGMHRVLAQPDGQIIHADIEARLSRGGEVSSLQDLVGDILAIEAQRWPGRPKATPRDFFPPTDDGRPLWVRLTRLAGGGGAPPGALYLALRPVHGVAPPALGLIDDPRVSKAIGHLCDEYADAPSLNALAERFEVSPFYFHRLFSRKALISPKHMVLRLQLVHARWRLRTSLTAISEIATGCGFASHGHFTATFHRLVGLTPLEYRLGQSPPM